MNARIHQFGILKSVGATPKQIRLCLIQEAAVLAGIPVLAGVFLGIVSCYGTICVMNSMVADMAGGREAVFSYHPVLFLLTVLIAAVTLLISVWIPSVKLSRLAPLEAIRGTKELELKKKKNLRMAAAVFGAEGELAAAALKAQKKALRTTALSLVLAFLGFTLMQCFFTLSGISTEHTYFEKYQDVWDVMASVKDTDISNFKLMNEIRNLPGIRSSTVYQRTEAVCVLPEQEISIEFLEEEGLAAAAGAAMEKRKDAYWIKAPLVILDDKSFLEYCRQTGTRESLDGAIVLNRIWDSVHSNFRNRDYIPYRKETQQVSMLRNINKEKQKAEIPILAYTEKEPVLREEYEDYTLVHILPLSLWEKAGQTLGGLKKDMQIQLSAKEGADLVALNRLEEQLQTQIGKEYEIETENRIFEKQNNEEVIKGYKRILGIFCILFAVIGIANVFSNTLGFLRQRKREFARYMSIGLTPSGMKKIFCIEAFVIVGRPFVTALLVTALAVGVMIRASYLDPAEFISRAPVLPIGMFAAAVFVFVAFAYYLGARQVLKCNLAEELRGQ